MKTIFLSFLAALSLTSALAQRQRLPHKSARVEKPIRVHLQYFRLSNRWYLKWTPSAFIPMPASEMRLGTEYCFAKRFGVGLEAGAISDSQPDGGVGFAIHPDARIYVGFRRWGRVFTGIEGFYRHQHFGSLSGEAYDYDHYGWYHFTQTSSTLNVYGAGVIGGLVIRLGPSPFHAEISAGIGGKGVYVSREGFRQTSPPDSLSRRFRIEGEKNIKDSRDIVYMIFNLKLTYLLPAMRRNQKVQE